MKLVERDTVATSLASHADDARRGRASGVLVRGPQGIGKTAVLDQVAAREAELGGTVLRVAHQGGRHPLNVLAQFLDVAPNAVFDDHAAPAEPYPTFQQLHRAITKLAAEQLVCLVIDDVPAHDFMTPRWLDFTLRRGEDLKLFVLVAPDANPQATIGDPLVDLAVHPHCRVIDLPPLTRDAVAGLLAGSLGRGPEPELVELCHRLSAGNPGLLNSVLARLRIPEHQRGLSILSAIDAVTVASAVVAKLVGLPDHAQAVAKAVAVIGRTDLELIGPVAEMPPDAVTDALNLLDREYLLWEGQPAELRERTHAAILETISETRLRRMRAKTAALLQNSGRPVDEVAQRLPEIERYSARARESASGKPSDRLGHAMELARTDPATALADLSELAEQTTDPAGRARLAVMFALTARACGQPERGAEMLLRAAKELDAAPLRPGTQSLRSQVAASQLAVALARPSTAGSAIKLASEIPWPDGHNAGELSLLGMLAETTMRAGGPVEDAVRHAKLAVSDILTADDWSIPASATVLRAAGRFDESQQVLDRATEYFAHTGDQLGHCRVLTRRARVQLATGALYEAEEDAQAAFTLAVEKAWLSHEPETGITLALAKAQLGKTEEATRLLTTVERSGLTGRPDTYADFLYAKAWSHLARFEWQAAVNDLWACGRAMEAARLPNPVLIPWWADAAVASARLLGDHKRAAAALERGRDLVGQWNTPEGVALVTMVEGMVTPGIRGTDLLVEAAERFAVLPTRLWHAFAQFTAGTELSQLGHQKSARPLLRSAIQQALSCGHPQWVAVAHRLLQDAGGRMRVSAGSEYDVLTSSERRIAELAAAGATNREIAGALFVSLRTVEVHLTRAYRKLGVTGRTGLRRDRRPS